MRKYTFTKNGYTFIRINKKEARRAYKNNLKILTVPHNMQLFNSWYEPFTLYRKNREHFILDDIGAENDFDNMVNSLEYYNCNNETGNYMAFYIPVIENNFDNKLEYNYKFLERN